MYKRRHHKIPLIKRKGLVRNRKPMTNNEELSPKYLELFEEMKKF